MTNIEGLLTRLDAELGENLFYIVGAPLYMLVEMRDEAFYDSLKGYLSKVAASANWLIHVDSHKAHPLL